MKLSHYLDKCFLPDRKAIKSEKVEGNYEKTVQHFCDLFGDMEIESIEQAQVERFRNLLVKAEGLAKDTAASHAKRLGSILAHRSSRIRAYRDDGGELVPTPRMTEKIVMVAGRMANGEKLEDIAKSLGITSRAILYWQKEYERFWNEAVDAAMGKAIEQIRKMAGTEAVAHDVFKYLEQATACDKWIRQHGGELFPPADSRPTLCQFFQSYYKPIALADAEPSTVRVYEIIMKRWRLLTGDPPMEDVTNATMASYKTAMSKLRGQIDPDGLSPNTVRSHLTMLQAVFDKAGKPCRYNRDAAGIIGDPPYVKKPRPVDRIPTIVDDSVLSAVYAAAEKMTVPEIRGIKPADWWRALLVVVFNTGVRRGTLFKLKWSHVDTKQSALIVPLTLLRKSRREQRFPLPPIVMEHLERIRKPEGLVFNYPYSQEMFNRHFRRLQELAGIPPDSRFGLHDIRRTHATRLWATNPAAAQLQLGHGSLATTIRHYVNTGIVADAVAAIKQPAGFGGGK